jgi:hypothetical protein
MEGGSLTHTTIWHNNSGKVKIVLLSDAKISGPCTMMNMIPDNCTPTNIHMSKNNIKKYDSNTIINKEVSRSNHQYYEVGTTPDRSSQYHRSLNINTVIATNDDDNISRQYNEGDTTTDNYIYNYGHNGNTNPVSNTICAIDPVSGIRSTTFNEMGSRPTISRHTHTNKSTDNAANDKIIHRTNCQYNVLETILDTGTHINNLSGHSPLGEHMRRITQFT